MMTRQSSEEQRVSAAAEQQAAKPEPADVDLKRLRRKLLGHTGRPVRWGPGMRLETEMSWLSDADVVREIHDHMPNPKIRQAFRATTALEAAPIIDYGEKGDPRLIAVLAATYADGRVRCQEMTLVPLQDQLGPWLARLDIALNQLVFILVSRERYLELIKLAEDTPEAAERRREILNELNPEATARTILPKLLARAQDLKASDIHIEPRGGAKPGYAVRFRIAGNLVKFYDLTIDTGVALVNILKLQADLRGDEHRLPQDGQITVDELDTGKHKEKLAGLALRLSTVHTAIRDGAEKAVLRMLRADDPERFSLRNLDFPQDVHDDIGTLLRSPHGLILTTGPTGSGKSTTLYSMLRHLNNGERNILTAEDPVEVRFPDIDQCQVNAQIDLGFARLLRSFLRQDPDVILVGEIRDEETGRIAVQAAQTGHLVCSTLHTNDAFGVLHRLRSFGITGSEIDSSLRAVIAQRLARRLCPACRQLHDAGQDLADALGETALAAFGLKLYRAGQSAGVQNCAGCGNTGYNGRLPVVELWVPSEAERHAIVYDADITHDALAQMAMGRGMKRMPQRALELVLAGETTLQEVIEKVTGIEELRQPAVRARLLELLEAAKDQPAV